MTGYTIFTHRMLGLERNVWVLMILVCLGSLGLLSYKMLTTKPCVPVRLEVKNALGNSRAFYPKTALRFVAYAENSKALLDSSREVIWDFGDRQGSNETGNLVFHSFLGTGDFKVRAIVDGGCEQELLVTIVSSPLNTEEVANIGNPIVLINSASQRVGEEVALTSDAGAKQYEWSIEGSSEPVKTGKYVTFIFNEPQTYTVKLMLDKDPKKTYRMPLMINPPRQTAKKTEADFPRILVPPTHTPLPTDNTNPTVTDPKTPDPAPVEPTKPEPSPSNEPEKPPRRYLYKNKDQFKTMLEEVISGSKNFKDFDPYLCDGGATLVIENGVQTNFERLCQSITGEKRIEDISVEYLDTKTYSDNSRCVRSLKVKYRKDKGGIFRKKG